MKTTDRVSTLPGVGEQTAKRLKKLGIATLNDLINHYPRRYDDFSQVVPISRLKPGQVSVKGRITSVNARRTRRNFHITEAVIEDESGGIKAVWFNQPYLAKQLRSQHDQEIYASGRLEFSYNQYALQNPTLEPARSFTKDTARIVPVYPETAGLSSKQLRGLLKQVLPLAHQTPENLPEAVIKQADLMSRPAALEQIHFPDTTAKLAAARRRIAFEELFLLVLTGLVIKDEVKTEASIAIAFDEAAARDFTAALGFRLTDAQRQAAWQILQDMQGTLNRSHSRTMQGSGEQRTESYKRYGKGVAEPLTQQRPESTSGVTGSASEQAGAVRAVQPMNRLLEGDVGSGKTVVAAMAAVVAAKRKVQTAMMVPTEVLAHQHYTKLAPLLAKLDVSCELLTGSLKPAAKDVVRARIEQGKVDVIIGTHALISSDVAFANLGLVVVDEQHRFGVKQRAALKAKAGRLPHLLSMTATPIPRSLALAVYGDLDISIINELPPGRVPIVTKVRGNHQREAVYRHIDEQIAAGRQVYVICPLIADSDKLGVKSVEAEATRLKGSVFKDRSMAVLHGRMKAADKQAVMDRFMSGDIDILVSTTVVEVGVDAPNATVMLIEGAERFGLATLHQLRGRVGRSGHQSYCYLLTTTDRQARARLKYMETINDGFRLANADLKFRGPGQIFGTRQHGLLDLRLADITDSRLVAEVRRVATDFYKDKQDLLQYKQLVEHINKLKTITRLD